QGVTAALAARDALRSTNGDDSHNSRTGVRRTERAARECTYTDFLKCQPLPFKGTEGVASLLQWCERMESVFHISNCTAENHVKFATCILHSVALTWWNTHVQTIKKLEMKLWELKVKGTDLASYTQRFQELALLCGRMFSEEADKIEKYVGGQKPTCYKCGVKGHYKRECPKLKNDNNQGGRNNAPARVYVVGRAGTDPDANVITADRRIFGLNTILRSCMLNLLNHPFDIDLMPVELEKYVKKGFAIFLAHITTKEVEDNSKEKRLEDVLVVRDFPKVFPEDLPGLPLIRPVEFQIDLVPGAAPVARAPYRLAHFEMKELAEQLKELSDKCFIRPRSSP
nr:putative reverse transcriptase domain-containing protein [Tanacetum cinerariifolium]